MSHDSGAPGVDEQVPVVAVALADQDPVPVRVRLVTGQHAVAVGVLGVAGLGR